MAKARTAKKASSLKKKPASKSAKSASAKSAKSVKSAIGLRAQGSQDIWPMERDVLFRPDRFKYVRKLVKPEGCVFCFAGKNKPSFDSLCVHQTAHSMIVLNKFPYNSGHLLVIPRRHCGELLGLSDAEYSDLNECLRMAMKAQQDLYQPAGHNLGMNHGAVAGAGIPEHLHYHLIPRWAGDVNFFPLIAETKVVIETLEQSWDRYHAHFQSLSGSHK